ncbi:MAG: carboxypeptidase regulatory-like domain-containing protein [Acidobacteriota bacterium]
MAARLILLGVFSVRLIMGQTITGSITGGVRDSSGLAVAAAEATLTHVATGVERRTTSNERGVFVFTSLQPGEYNLAIRVSGFKTAERRGVVVSASQTLPVGDVVLEVGSVTESITVAAQGSVVQTASAERAGVVTSSQVDTLLIKGRNVMSLLQLLPGVVDNRSEDVISRTFSLNIQGGRANTHNVSVDGVPVTDIGNGTSTTMMVAMDAVAEVKVLLSNYQAEYGRTSGASIQLVTKSGTKDFHGMGSYFKRHEQFNANNFFNNRLGTPKPRYRFNTWTYNIGGPLYIPKRFNTNRDKLFFFWSQEYWPLKASRPIAQLTVPTEPERAGDFSQTLDLNGALIRITDPGSRQPFPGNRVPANRIDPNGQALLKFFPAPNFFDRNISAGRYNYVFQSDNDIPQRTETLKLDYNFNSRNLLFGNFSDHLDLQTGAVGIPTSGGTNWPQMRKTFANDGKAAVLRFQRIVSPTLVNELNLGFSYRTAYDRPDAEDERRNQKESAGYRLSQFNPASNPLNLIPNATFGGVVGAANLTVEGRYPLDIIDTVTSVANNVSKTTGAHSLKAGIYSDRFTRNTNIAVNFQGNFSFARNVNNPLDSNYAYSNAMLGVFDSYTEASTRPFVHLRMSNVEWFVQDNWKVHKRLTLDFGMRFAWVQPMFERENRIAGFAPERFDPARQVQLIRPATVNGQRSGVHPVTGAVYPAVFIGAIAPGTGDVANGMVVPSNDGGYPRSLIADRGIHYAPRFGFSFDPIGKGKTAVRGGFGMFYNRINSGVIQEPHTSQPPVVQNPVIRYGSMSTLLSSSGLLFPQNVLGLDREGKVPTTMNMSVTVQQDVGFGTVIDVGYVGSLSRHQMWQRNLTAIPFGVNFDPANADPTNPRVPLQPAFLRSRVGYENINYREFASSSNYHSLEMTANRHFTQALQFGASWTWSKAMDFNDGDTGAVSDLVPVRVWNYGLAGFDRTHNFKLNWMWDTPRTPFRAGLVKAALNDWTLSGITSFISGAPLGLGFSQVVATDITGSPTDGPRIVVTANPVLPKSERTFSQNFRTDVFRMPPVGTIGNAAKTLIRGPGINNWDLAVFKNFPVGDRMRFQFRCEMYNAFNHTQFSNLDTAARFDAQGRQVNARFGEFTAARNPRQMQLALRFYF